MQNISFSGSRVPINPSKKLINSTASEFAAAINKGYKLASQDFGRPIKPIRRISGKTLRKLNPDSFCPKTRKLTQAGKEGFEAINGKMLGLTLDSKLNDFVQGVRKYIIEFAYPDPVKLRLDHFFDYFTK